MKTNKAEKPNDEQLVTRLQNGDNSAMQELYLRYYMLVFSRCRSFAKNTDDANDYTHDIMLRVMEKIGSFKREARFSTWLYAITFNYCTDMTRKAKGKYFDTLDALSEPAMAYEPGLQEDHSEVLAQKALMAISSDEQEILSLKYQHNHSIQDLQVRYNLSASAVKMRLKRARGKAGELYSSYQLGAA